MVHGARPSTPAMTLHNDDGESSDGDRVLGWMLEQLTAASATELRARLVKDAAAAQESAQERRLRELGHLRLMTARAGGYVMRAEYDPTRPKSALSAATLVRRFGSWRVACAAAASIADDGSMLSSTHSWRSTP